MTIMIRTMIITPISPPITPPAIGPGLEEACGGGSGDEVSVADGDRVDVEAEKKVAYTFRLILHGHNAHVCFI